MLSELWTYLEQGAQLQIKPHDDVTVESITYTPHKSLNKLVVSARLRPGCSNDLKHNFTHMLYGTDEHLYNQTLPLDYQSFYQSVDPILQNKRGTISITDSNGIGRGQTLTLEFDHLNSNSHVSEQFQFYNHPEENRVMWISVFIVVLILLAMLILYFI